MKDVVFVSVAFGFEYLKQMDRLQKSILKIYPEANLLFFDNGLPNGSRSFYDSLYGFKPHAIQEARNQGYKKVIWLDPAMILVDKIDRYFNYHMIAAIDDNKLSQTISDKFLKYVGLTRDAVHNKGWHLVGGSFYYFDFDKPVSNMIFDAWMKYEVDGYFGSQYEAASEQINSHRNDESCMAVAMYTNGMSPYPHDEIGYCAGEHPVFIKKHFK